LREVAVIHEKGGLRLCALAMHRDRRRHNVGRILAAEAAVAFELVLPGQAARCDLRVDVDSSGRRLHKIACLRLSAEAHPLLRTLGHCALAIGKGFPGSGWTNPRDVEKHARRRRCYVSSRRSRGRYQSTKRGISRRGSQREIDGKKTIRMRIPSMGRRRMTTSRIACRIEICPIEQAMSRQRP
jgi:hypothetical protein